MIGFECLLKMETGGAWNGEERDHQIYDFEASAFVTRWRNTWKPIITSSTHLRFLKNRRSAKRNRRSLKPFFLLSSPENSGNLLAHQNYPPPWKYSSFKSTSDLATEQKKSGIGTAKNFKPNSQLASYSFIFFYKKKFLEFATHIKPPTELVSSSPPAGGLSSSRPCWIELVAAARGFDDLHATEHCPDIVNKVFHFFFFCTLW